MGLILVAALVRRDQVRRDVERDASPRDEVVDVHLAGVEATGAVEARTVLSVQQGSHQWRQVGAVNAEQKRGKVLALAVDVVGPCYMLQPELLHQWPNTAGEARESLHDAR